MSPSILGDPTVIAIGIDRSAWIEGMFFTDATWFYWIKCIKYLDWQFTAESDALVIRLQVEDSVHGGPTISAHRFALPRAFMPYDERMMFVFDCIMKVHLHEAREFFTVSGDKVFFPKHDGIDVYKWPKLT